MDPRPVWRESVRRHKLLADGREARRAQAATEGVDCGTLLEDMRQTAACSRMAIPPHTWTSVVRYEEKRYLRGCGPEVDGETVLAAISPMASISLTIMLVSPL